MVPRVLPTHRFQEVGNGFAKPVQGFVIGLAAVRIDRRAQRLTVL